MQAILVFVFTFISVLGCRSTGHRDPYPGSIAESKQRTSTDDGFAIDSFVERPASKSQSASNLLVGFERRLDEDVAYNITNESTLKDDSLLTLPQLIAEVQEMNPTLEAMNAAWRAAIQRIPQATSLEDPMLGTTVAPASFGSNQVESAYAIEVSQKLPWHGKRGLRGTAARTEANTAALDYTTARQKLNEITELEFWEYFSSQKLLELNKQSSSILKSIRANAEVRYRTGLVTERDVLQADVELANLEQRSIELSRMNRVAKGNLNALLRRNPADDLAISMSPIDDESAFPDVDTLIGIAVAQRPEISALASQIQTERAKVELAVRQFYPDTELFYRHDTFWQPRATQSDLREQVGVRMNLPIYHKRLNAAVCEAKSRVSKLQAEHDQLVLDIERDVNANLERVLESQKTVELLTSTLIPTAERNVSAARSNYDNSKSTFTELASSQRQLIEFRERLLQSQVELKRRTATLVRVVGGITLLDEHKVANGK